MERCIIDWAHFEINGHVLFPELAIRPDSIGTGHKFRQSLKKLEREAQEERRKEHERKAAEQARLLAKQKAKAEDEFYLSDEDDYFANPKLRAKVLKSKVTGLLEPPPEVLTTIVEDCSMDTCRRLRLVHPELAHLHFMKRKLFSQFVLTPNPAKLYRVVRMSDSVAPFVSILRMKPIIIGGADNPRNYSVTKVKKDLKPAVDAAMRSGKALSAWTGFLRKVRPGVKLLIEYPENENNPFYICAGPAPEAFMRLVTESLADSACEMGALDLEHCSVSALVVNNIPGWSGLRLQYLKTLNFSFTLDIGRKDEAYLQDLPVQCAAELRKLLQGEKIQELIVDMDASCLFERGDLPDLPVIRDIKLRSTTRVDPVCFSKWLSSLPSLRELTLYVVSAGKQNTLHEWQPIFDAIKSHPGMLSLEFVAQIARPTRSVRLYFEHQVGEGPVKNVRHYGYDGVFIGNAVHMVRNYLSGFGDWDIFGL